MCAKKTTRLPYKFFEFRSDVKNNSVCVWIVDKDDQPNLLDPYFPLDLHPDFANFFIENGLCANCNAPIKKDFSKCDCTLPIYGNVPANPKYHLVINTPRFGHLIERERLRVHQNRREQRMAKSNKKITKKQVDELFNVQEGRCYYCGILLTNESGKRYFHKDHYFSLENGGSHSIDNIVLSCAPCNIKKREMDGDEFSFSYSNSLSPAEKRRMPKIRKNVDTFHQEQKKIDGS